MNRKQRAKMYARRLQPEPVPSTGKQIGIALLLAIFLILYWIMGPVLIDVVRAVTVGG